MSVLNIRVPLEMKEKLERRAAAAGVAVSEIVRQAIEASQGGVWVAYYPQHVSAARGIPFSTEVEALRWALANGHGMMQVKRVPFGSDIYDETGE